MQSQFSIRLKERRKELGLTQKELGSAIDTTGTTISQFESNIRKPSYITLKKLSSALLVTTDYLIGRKDIATEDFLADKRISEMLEGMVMLPEKEKDMLFRVYQGMALLKLQGK